VRLDLGAETEQEPPAGEHLKIVGLQRDRHRVARERHGDTCAQFDAGGALGGDSTR